MSDESPSSPPPFKKTFHGFSRVRKMLEVFSHSVSNYVRTFLRRGLRAEDTEFNRDRSFSEGDVNIIKSVSIEWPRSSSFCKRPDNKTQTSHSSMMRPLSPYFRPISPSFRDDNFLDVPSRPCSRCLGARVPVHPSPNGENSLPGTPKHFGYGSEFDDIPWITTPRSVTSTSSEHNSSPHTNSLLSPKKEKERNENGKPVRPTSLLIPFTPAFDMSPQQFHFYNLRNKVWRNLYWKDAIKWEEDQATIKQLLQLQKEAQRINQKLMIPELKLPVAAENESAKSPVIADQSINSPNNNTLDVPEILITLSDDSRTTASTKCTPLSFSSFSEAVQSNSPFPSYTALTESYTSTSEDIVPCVRTSVAEDEKRISIYKETGRRPSKETDV